MPKRTCAICKLKFEKEDLRFPPGSLRGYCSSGCGAALSLELTAKKRKQYDKDFRAETKKLKDQQNENSTSFLRKKAQKAFNRYIRTRDKDQSCISCDRTDKEIEDVFRGGKWDCGHYLSVGSHAELRFEPLNAYKQCKSCNGGAGNFTKKNHTVTQSYRKRLIDKIGIDKVSWLEGLHEAKRYRLQDYKDVYKQFTELTKNLGD